MFFVHPGLALAYPFDFSGLWYDDSVSLVRGHASSAQYSLGAFANDPGGSSQIPGPFSDSGNPLQVEKVELLVRKDC